MVALRPRHKVRAIEKRRIWPLATECSSSFGCTRMRREEGGAAGAPSPKTGGHQQFVQPPDRCWWTLPPARRWWVKPSSRSTCNCWCVHLPTYVGRPVLYPRRLAEGPARKDTSREQTFSTFTKDANEMRQELADLNTGGVTTRRQVC